MIRLSELWYIISEAVALGGVTATIETFIDDKIVMNTFTGFDGAAKAIDVVRLGRNCSLGGIVINDLDSFKKELIKEVRREFFAEGQAFFYHKKLGLNVIKDVEISDDKYYFPKVQSENIF